MSCVSCGSCEDFELVDIFINLPVLVFEGSDLSLCLVCFMDDSKGFPEVFDKVVNADAIGPDFSPNRFLPRFDLKTLNKSKEEGVLL